MGKHNYNCPKLIRNWIMLSNIDQKLFHICLGFLLQNVIPKSPQISMEKPLLKDQKLDPNKRFSMAKSERTPALNSIRSVVGW